MKSSISFLHFIIQKYSHLGLKLDLSRFEDQIIMRNLIGLKIRYETNGKKRYIFFSTHWHSGFPNLKSKTFQITFSLDTSY